MELIMLMNLSSSADWMDMGTKYYWFTVGKSFWFIGSKFFGPSFKNPWLWFVLLPLLKTVFHDKQAFLGQLITMIFPQSDPICGIRLEYDLSGY